MINHDQMKKFSKLSEKVSLMASKSLSKLVGHKSIINLSESTASDPMYLFKQFGSPESIVFATVLKVEGDLTGFILVVWPIEQASRMAKKLTGSDLSGPELAGLEKSSLEEIANIVTSSFLTEINKTSRFKVLQSIPESKNDMLKAILDEISAYMAQKSKNILMLTTQLEISLVKSSAFFSVVLDAESGKKLIEALPNE